MRALPQIPSSASPGGVTLSIPRYRRSRLGFGYELYSYNLDVGKVGYNAATMSVWDKEALPHFPTLDSIARVVLKQLEPNEKYGGAGVFKTVGRFDAGGKEIKETRLASPRNPANKASVTFELSR